MKISFSVPLVACAVAMFLSSAAAKVLKNQLINFESQNGQVLLAGPAPSSLQGLDFSQFRLGTQPDIQIIALLPSSPKNFIIISLLATTSTATIKLAPGSKSFDLKKISAGCFLKSGNGFEQPPVDCNIAYVGKKLDSRLADVSAIQKFRTGGVGGIALKSEPVVPFAFPIGFDGLASITVTASVDAAVDLTGVNANAAVQFEGDDVLFDLTLY